MNGAGQIVAAGPLDGPRGAQGRPAGEGADHAAVGRRRLPHRLHGLGPRRSSRASSAACARPSRAGCCSPTPTARPSTPAPRCCRRLVSQVTSPVRFDACLATMRELGVTAVDRTAAGRRAGRPGQARVEGRRRSRLARRLSSPDDLDRARELHRGRTRPHRGRAPARLAGRRLPGPRHGQPGRDRRGQPSARPAPRWAASAAAARRSTSRPPTTGYSPSGSSTTATSSTPVTRSPVSTRRSPRDAPIQLPTGAPGARILGLGAYRPRRRVTNDDLAQMMDTNDEWIQSRVGIAERRWAERGRDARRDGRRRRRQGDRPPAAWPPDEIDLVIVASASLRAPIPGIGPQVGAPAGHPPPGRLRPQRRLRRVLLRPRRRVGQHPRRVRPQRAGRRRRAAHRRHRPRGPLDRGDLRRRRGRRRGRRRPTSRASARWSGAATATSTTPSRSPPAARR